MGVGSSTLVLQVGSLDGRSQIINILIAPVSHLESEMGGTDDTAE